MKKIKALLLFVSHKPLYLINPKIYLWYLKNDKKLYKYDLKFQRTDKSNFDSESKVRYQRGITFLPANYLKKKLDANAGGNVGNYVFERAMETYLLNKDNFDTRGEKPPEIVVESCANLLAEVNINQMRRYINRFKKSYSRHFFIGLGSQSDVDYSFNYSTEAKKTMYNFVKTVLDTGGGIGLRGYYTAELLKKLGFRENDFTVTGCPSLFVNGRNFKINKNENLKEDELKTILTDYIQPTLLDNKCENFLKKYISTYICQDECYPYMYGGGEKLLSNLNLTAKNMFCTGKVKLFLDIDEWIKEIKKHNFSFGRRFHGNALAITNNVPAVINIIDSRTRELAEFFDIPHIKIKDYSNLDLYEVYQNADYSKFNKTYNEKFDNFKSFFEKHGIPNYIGEKNEYISWLIKNKHNPNLLMKECQENISPKQ